VRDLTPGQLTSGWRALLAISWVGVLVALIAVDETADFIGKPTWFQLHSLTALPFVLPAVAGVIAYINLRWTSWSSAVGVVSMGATAAVTRSEAPGAALVLGAVALGMLLITVACQAGRVVARADGLPEPATGDVVPHAGGGVSA
jgi:hypothetical protein